MSIMPFLEDFTSAPAPQQADQPPPPPPGWQAGYEAGVDAGRREAHAAQDQLSAATAQSLADLSFSFAAARHVVLQQITPLLQLVADKIVPQILQATLGAALAEELIAAAQHDMARPIPLRLAPVDCAAVADIAAKVAGCALAVTPDPELRPGQALIGGPAQLSAFDSQTLADDLAAALHALCAEPPRSFAHG